MKREIGRNYRQREWSYGGPRRQILQQSIAQYACKSAFRSGLCIDIFINEALPRECASKSDHIVVDFAPNFALLTCKPQQLGASMSEQEFKFHAWQRRCFHRTAQKEVVCKRDDAFGAEQFEVCYR